MSHQTRPKPKLTSLCSYVKSKSLLAFRSTCKNSRRRRKMADICNACPSHGGQCRERTTVCTQRTTTRLVIANPMFPLGIGSVSKTLVVEHRKSPVTLSEVFYYGGWMRLLSDKVFVGSLRILLPPYYQIISYAVFSVWLRFCEQGDNHSSFARYICLKSTNLNFVTPLHCV